MKNRDETLRKIQRLLDVGEGNLHAARNLLLDIVGREDVPAPKPAKQKKAPKPAKAVKPVEPPVKAPEYVKPVIPVNHEEKAKELQVIEEGKIIEGVFEGEQMISPDGKRYPVPANYASKSKLVEGDILKLTIADDGSLIYKQIKPTDRRTIVGTLTYENGNYFVIADQKRYKILFASVTYYKGKPGDKVSVSLPKDTESSWVALETVLHDYQEPSAEEAELEEEAKKFDLPKENLEMLENVKNQLFTEEKQRVENERVLTAVPEKEPVKEASPVSVPVETAPVEEPITEQPVRKNIPRVEPEVTFEPDTTQANMAEQQAPAAVRGTDETLENVRNAAENTNNDTFVKEESDANAIGETQVKGAENGGIEELEI